MHDRKDGQGACMTLVTPTVRPRFSADDAERAHKNWHCNCGPAAIAAICGMTLDEVRPFMCDFEAKGYTNPTLMWRVLKAIGIRFSYKGGYLGTSNWPRSGLARIQWEGPWTEPGVPARAAYRHTHWVGAIRDQSGIVSIFDINALGNGTGWLLLDEWELGLVPHILEHHVPRANGGWHITHAVEVGRPC